MDPQYNWHLKAFTLPEFDITTASQLLYSDTMSSMPVRDRKTDAGMDLHL